MRTIQITGVKDAELTPGIKQAVDKYAKANPTVAANPELEVKVGKSTVKGRFHDVPGLARIEYDVTHIDGVSTAPTREKDVRPVKDAMDRRRKQRGQAAKDSKPIPPLFGFNSEGEKTAAANTATADAAAAPAKAATKAKAAPKKKGSARKKGAAKKKGGK